MKLSLDRLQQNLSKRLFPVYLVYGDETLQRGEAADAIRFTAKSNGYSNREVFDAESGFQWERFIQSCDSLPLFAEKRLLDLRILSASPGKQGARVLQKYALMPAEDLVIIISCGKLTASVQKSAWFTAIDSIGIVVQVWPLTGARLLKWIDARAKKKGMQINRAGLDVLADRVEGNMLAAAQEIDKLFVLNGVGEINENHILNSVADCARYDVFALVDSALSGDAKRVYKILASIQREGVAFPVILWALTREIRLLHQVDFEVQKGHSIETVLRNKKVWENRKALLRSALSRCNNDNLNQLLQLGARLDRVIKGRESGDTWEMMLALCMGLAGVESVGTGHARI